jgi:hypothetical protein
MDVIMLHKTANHQSIFYAFSALDVLLSIRSELKKDYVTVRNPFSYQLVPVADFNRLTLSACRSFQLVIDNIPDSQLCGLVKCGFSEFINLYWISVDNR